MDSFINILIVDDDKDDAAFLTEGISNIISSFRVFTATNGSECLGFLLENEPPELIFMDLNMPKLNGFNCLKALKADPYLKDTHIVIFSTSSDLQHIEESYLLGAKYYIVKPVTLGAMTNMLEQMFKGLGRPSAESSDRKKFHIKERKKQL